MRGMTAFFGVLSASVLDLSLVSAQESHSRSADVFFSALSDLAGSNAIDCGRLSLGSKLAAGFECARSAMQSGRPFQLAVQIQGVDSILWQGAARGKSGAIWLVTFDSDIHGGGANSVSAEPRITRTPCLGLMLSMDDESPLSCAPLVQGRNECHEDVVPCSR